MDVKAYISSGILEQYVLGLLSPEESREVERMAEEHPEVRQEIGNIEDALAQYARAHAIPMPEGLPEKIMSRISDTPPPPAMGGRSFLSNGLMLVLLAGLIGASILAYQYLQQRNDLQDQLQQSQESFQVLTNDCDSCQARVASLEEQIIILKSEAYQTIRMLGTDKDPAAIASVYYNTTEQKSFLDLASLPELPAGKQYQLWAIVEAGPTGMGVFDLPLDPYSIFEVPYVPGAQAFAITVEDAGGVEAPTLTEMIVLGTVS